MKLLTSIALIVATLIGSFGFAGNGIERGDKLNKLRGLSFVGYPLNEEAKTRVAQIVVAAMSTPTQFSGVAYTEDIREIGIDQGTIDMIYDMRIMTIDEFGKIRNLHLVLRESSFSNPAFDNFEVLELSKK